MDKLGHYDFHIFHHHHHLMAKKSNQKSCFEEKIKMKIILQMKKHLLQS